MGNLTWTSDIPDRNVLSSVLKAIAVFIIMGDLLCLQALLVTLALAFS